MTPEAAKTIVAPFYDTLNQPAKKAVAGIIGEICHADWRSFAGETSSKGRGEFIAQVVGFGKLVAAYHVEVWAGHCGSSRRLEASLMTNAKLVAGSIGRSRQA